MQSVVVHAHFYQPPREDPWFGLVEREHSAAPWHDWNIRIERECYRPMTAARIQAPDGRIRRIVNLFEQISFDAAPTLLSWLEAEAPDTYAAILHGDQVSRGRLGVGNAMAMPYHHVIMPLASRRDKVTEVRWGIRDFRRRFGREPEGMWLPETAADQETLDVLAGEGIRFTVLAPHQVTPVPLHGLPGSVRTAGGKRLAVFIYDGDLAHGVAFGPLLRDAESWALRMALPPDHVGGPKLVSLATDGETYGHHHRFGEMALAAALERVGSSASVRIENFGSFLEAHPPRETVDVVTPGSWSCIHGVERWRADCGCRTKPEMSQAWRAPLRNGLDWLRNRLDLVYEAEGRPLLGDPWEARDAVHPAEAETLPVRARELLEMQWQARRMFTSCGWFFDDIAGLEPLQLLRSAARAIELAGDAHGELRTGLLTWLREAKSNDASLGDGASLFDRQVVPGIPAEARAAAAIAALAALLPEERLDGLGTLQVRAARRDAVTLRHRRTGRETSWRAEVHRDSVVHLRALVAPAEGDAPGVTLTFPDLPEAVREIIRRGSQPRLLATALGTRDCADIASGLLTFDQAIRQAMLRHLGPDAAHADIAALTAALDLLALEAHPVPFETQTVFYRHYLSAAEDQRLRLEPLRERFGFSDLAAG